MVKNISVVIAGSGDIRDIGIKPGTTAGDILRQLNLNGYVLSKGQNEPPFGNGENIYPLVRDGDKLYASTPATVGR
jgi:hypothetical protein